VQYIPKINDAEWLVSVPDGKTFTAVLTAACKGNVNLANLLNYLLFEAAREAKKQGIKKNDAEYIEIKRKQDTIIQGLSKHNKTLSKRTLHMRMLNLTSLTYISADTYHHTYRVYHHIIEKAFQSPPEVEKAKPRGRHAASKASSDEMEDVTFNSKFTSSSKDEIIKALLDEVNALKEKVNTLEAASQANASDEQNVKFNISLKNDILEQKLEDMEAKMLNLTFQLSSERACREALEAKIVSLYSIRYSNDTDNSSNELLNGHSPESVRKNGHKGKTTKTPSQKEKPAIVLSFEEQAVFDEWAKMPWFKSVPDLQSNDPAHLRKLAPYNPTVETMLKCKNWATSKAVDTNGWYKSRGWSLYALAKEYPRWLSTQTIEAPPSKPQGDMTQATEEYLDEYEQRERILAAERAKQREEIHV
jgi:hypothetical protein